MRDNLCKIFFSAACTKDSWRLLFLSVCRNMYPSYSIGCLWMNADMPTSQSSNINTEFQTLNSATSTPKNVKVEDKKTKTLLHILPKLPSNDSLNSPGPASPGNFAYLF